MPQLAQCSRCSSQRPFVYQTPCCITSDLTFCATCLKSTARCFVCKSHFDSNKCVKVYPSVEMISTTQYRLCPHEKCTKSVDILLYDFHVANCPFLPTISSSMIEKLDPNFVDLDEQKKSNLQSLRQYLDVSCFDHKTGVYSHPVIQTDTMMGLTLKYGVTAADIKKMNNLWSGNIHERATIKILLKDLSKFSFDLRERDLEREALKLFKKKTKASVHSEAVFYLKAANYNVDEAVGCYLDDQEWEKENPTRKGVEEKVARVEEKKQSSLLGFCSFEQISS